MEENPREFWIRQNRFYLDEDETLYITIDGEIDDEDAFEVKKTILELNKRFGRKRRNSLVDINRARKVSSGARRTFKEIAEDEEIGRGKTAIFGLHPVARVLASFLLGVTKTRHLRFFNTKEEALAWLERENVDELEKVTR
jgi:hypothetical protein